MPQKGFAARAGKTAAMPTAEAATQPAHTMTMLTSTQTANLSDELHAYATSIEGTSLYLLRAIEETVGALGSEEKLARAQAELAELLTTRIRALQASPSRFIDPDDAIIDAFEGTYQQLESMLPRMLQKKSSIDKDGNLNDGHCERLHDAYEAWLNTVASLIEALKNLRASIIGHDLAAERGTSTEAFDSVTDLIGSLHA
jgi:hypothetical protein